MSQSLQDDLFEDLFGEMAACISKTQSTLVLAALKRTLNEDELEILQRNSIVADHLGGKWGIAELERRLNA